jgi:hypothetical protein
MKTGIIIVNYNDFTSTEKLINNIKDYRVIDKIVVVDNHSSDDSPQKLKKLKLPKLKVIINEENKGYSYAINTGAKYLIDEYKECNIIISNADVIIEKEEDIETLIKLLHRKNVGIVAPTILERGTKNRGWKNPTPKQEIVLNLAYIHRFFRKKYLYYDDDYYQGDFSIVDVLSGCFFLIQSKTLQAVNYLDDHVFLYYEENILAKKLQVKKKINLISNKVTIIHNHSVTIDKSLKRIKKYKAQKKSQYYFEVEYNNASLLERMLLKLTAWLSQIILSIGYFIQDLLRK